MTPDLDLDFMTLRADLIRDEGLRLQPYLDSTGHWTIGVGHNLSANGITKEQALQILEADIDQVVKDLEHYLPFWSSLDGVRKRVLANMAFNLGIFGLLQWEPTLSHIEAGDYAAAARHMRGAPWAKQVGARAERLAVLMEHGGSPPGSMVSESY